MNQSAAKQPQHRQKRVSTVTTTGNGATHSADSLHPLLQLQRTIGNQAVQHFLKRRDHWDTYLQPAGLSIQRNPTPGDYHTGSPPVEDDVSIPEQTVGDSLPATDLGDQLSGTNEGSQSVEELLSGELANNPAIVAINQHFEAVEHVKQAIDAAREGEKTGTTWKFLDDPSVWRRYREGDAAQHNFMVGMAGIIRTAIEALPEQDFGAHAERVSEIQAYYYRLLNTLTPYFTQMANLDILFAGGWSSTCNVTSLSMALNALGLNQQNFATGTPRDVLVKIAVLRAGQIEQKLEVDTFDKVAALRMPDFLQFVVIYARYIANGGSDGSEPDFVQRVNTARSQMVSGEKLLTKSIAWFAEVAELMGAQRKADGQISNSGELATYRRNVEGTINPHLDAGGQIVVNRPGHYVRLQDIDDHGITYDDPYSTGKASTLSWYSAHEKGYFRSYQVFYKG